MYQPASLTVTLLCLIALCGCEQPQAPGGAAAVQTPQQPPAPPVAPPSAAARPPAVTAPQTGSLMSAPASAPPDLESLVLTPEARPFADTTPHAFGSVPGADWLAAPAGTPAQDRLLPDMFRSATTRRRVNVGGELLLDDSQETTKMLDGVGMKVEINTD